MSRTIVNSSDGLNSWDIEQSTSTATNTGIVERVITGVNVSVAFIQDTRTNLITYSEDFSNAYWTKSGSSVSSGFLSPDGTANAFKLVEDTSTGLHSVAKINFNVIAEKYSASIYVKPNGRNEVRLTLDNYFIFPTYTTFNLDTGIVTLSAEAENGKIETLQNGWFRCSFTSKSVAIAGSGGKLFIQTSVNSNTPYQGDGTSGVYIYGAQVEQNSYATSYIPTQGTAVTVDSNSTSVVNNTGIVERPITGVSDGLNSWDIEQSTGTTNSTTTIRYIN